MKKIIAFFFFSIPLVSFSQNADIYTKWYAIIDDNTQVILDLSKSFQIKVSRIKVVDDKHYRIDSFGNKRPFNSMLVDMDSNTIIWSGSMTPLHPSIETEYRCGIIKVIEKNLNGLPQKLRFSGDLPELSIDLDEHDSITFTRMITKNDYQIEYHYTTNYGGEVERIRYLDEPGGASVHIKNFGVQFSHLKFKNSIGRTMSRRILEKINASRIEKGMDILNHDLVLDTASRDKLNEWMSEAKKQHRLNIHDEFEDNTNKDSSICNEKTSKYNFIHYPFRCGENATAIQLDVEATSNKRKLKKYMIEHYEEYVEALYKEWAANSGMKQNMYNPGYAGFGNSIAMYRSTLDDFYFNHAGEKIDVRDKKTKYYHLILAQTFSVFEKQ